MSRAEAHPPETPDIPPPGAQLRAAREAQGLSISEAAARLHLHQRMVEALESDDESRLPPPIFARGYLRNYARLTGLDPERIIAGYEQLGQKPPELKPPKRPPGQASSSDRPVKAFTYLLTLGLVLLLVAWWQSRNLGDDGLAEPEAAWQDTATAPETDSASPAAEQSPPAADHGEEAMRVKGLDYPLQVVRHPDTPIYPLPAQGAPAADAGDSPAGAAPPANVETVQVPPVPGETPEGAPATRPDPAAETGTADPSATTGAETAAAADGPAATDTRDSAETALLRLDLNADSWIEVYDADGERIYMGLGRAGESLTFDGRLPLEIVLGYAPGVEVTFRGRTIDLDRHSRSGVARFTVGD